MVCVPSGVTQVERSAVVDATRVAGASRAYLIEEPLAAAIGAELPVAESIGSLVVDVGGGTSEMAVTALGGMVVSIRFESAATTSTMRSSSFCKTDSGLLIGQEQAETVKFEIGAAINESGESAVAGVAGRDLATGLLRRVMIDADSVSPPSSVPLHKSLKVSSSYSSGHRPNSLRTSPAVA